MKIGRVNNKVREDNGVRDAIFELTRLSTQGGTLYY